MCNYISKVKSNGFRYQLLVLLGIAWHCFHGDVTREYHSQERSRKAKGELFTIEKTNQTCTAFTLAHKGFLKVCKITVNHRQCILSGSDDRF